MGTKKVLFRCTACQYEYFKWQGRCPGCGSWNTLAEVEADPLGRRFPREKAARVVSLREVPDAVEARFSTGIGELDRVLGGGLVAGSVVLLGGDPGMGKSTLLLQAAANLASTGSALYASGEESLHQLKLRARRLQIQEDLPVLAATELEDLLASISAFRPDLLVVDSVQSFFRREVDGVPGSISQVREVAAELVRLAKEQGIAVFLVGHVTKEGIMAGPRLLEHMVDTVLYLEGDRYHSFRILRGVKNRFGSTNEIGVFMMEEKGLVEVANPSHLFITRDGNRRNGAVVTASMEGTRPLLVEIQSLVTATNYPTPRRTTAGIDLNRVALILAVLEKHAGISFVGLDTFVNVVGGVRLMETAVDLALAVSLVSSLQEKSLPEETVVMGEVGLTGEIRPVGRVAQRVMEGVKLGFKKFILPEANLADLESSRQRLQNVALIGVENIREAVGVSLS